MSVNDARPDMGACSGIPDMGAWQFVIPDGLRDGTFHSKPVATGKMAPVSAGTSTFLGRPAATGEITGTSAGTGALNSHLAIEGKFGADQS